MKRSLLAAAAALLLCGTAHAKTHRPPADLCRPPSEGIPSDGEDGAGPLAAGLAAPPLAPVPPLVVSRVSKAGRRVALTFDACSVKRCSEYDERITAILRETGTPATIFIGGRWAAQQRPHVRELAQLPNIEIGNHTWSHPPMTRLGPRRRQEEIRKTQAELFSLTGRQPTLFRPPYGQYDRQVVEEAAKLGLTTVEYDVASGDPDRAATRDRLVRWVLRKARPGSIVVMHINRRGWHTAEALPEIIAGLRKRKFELVTVSELLSRGPPDTAAPAVMNVAGRPPRKAKAATTAATGH